MSGIVLLPLIFWIILLLVLNTILFLRILERSMNASSHNKGYSSSGSSNSSSSSSNISIRVVVMNPRCFAYLDNRRYINNKLKELDDDMKYNCPNYNEWIWGLDYGGFVIAPYKDYSIRKVGGITKLIHRYLTERNVIYLNGEYDTIQYENENCGSSYQGKNRLQRGLNYYKSIQEILNNNNKNDNDDHDDDDDDDEYDHLKKTKILHKHMVVKMVNHNHCLMLQSPEGQQALFGDQS